MKELKAFNCVESDLQEFCEPRLVYLKDDADKVISEKDETIDEFKERNDELQKATDSAWSKVNAMYDELRHQKYKRCLAMQNMCRYAQYSYSYLMENESCKILPNNIDFRRYNKKYHFYIRWRKRWIELAEKFKPNSTAQ